MKFHIIELADEPEGYVNVSTSAEWESWIRHCLPDGLDQEVRRRLVSNLKHVTVGLELKAALIVPHAERGAGPSLLFEPYLHIMNFEFWVGVFSICEGVGSALWFREHNLDGCQAAHIGPQQRHRSPINKFAPSQRPEIIPTSTPDQHERQ